MKKTAVGVAALVAASVTFVLVPVSFVLWISAALSYGGDTVAVVFMGILIAGLVITLAAVVVVIVRLAIKAPPALSIATIVVGVLPLLGGLALAFSDLVG